MTLLEKTKASADTTRLTLYKEGIFYKCYNEDAMIFVQKVRNYKITTRFVKSVGSEVLSLGFPFSEVENGKLSLAEIHKRIGAVKLEELEKRFVFYLEENLKEEYCTWAEQIIQKHKPKADDLPKIEGKPDIAHLVLMIKNFDLANSTPMQGLNFIQELKTVVKKLD